MKPVKLSHYFWQDDKGTRRGPVSVIKMPEGDVRTWVEGLPYQDQLNLMAGEFPDDGKEVGQRDNQRTLNELLYTRVIEWRKERKAYAVAVRLGVKPWGAV